MYNLKRLIPLLNKDNRDKGKTVEADKDSKSFTQTSGNVTYYASVPQLQLQRDEIPNRN